MSFLHSFLNRDQTYMGKDMDNGASQSCNAIHNFWMQQQSHMLPQRTLFNNTTMKRMHVAGHAGKNTQPLHYTQKELMKPNKTQGSLHRKMVSWD